MSHDLSGVKRAIEALDRRAAEVWEAIDALPTGRAGANSRQAVAWFDELEALDREVGRAFGEATVDVNSIDTCASCVRAGWYPHCQTGPGRTWVRSAVERWEQEQAEAGKVGA